MSADQLKAHQNLETRKVYKKSRCVKIIYDVPDVEGYLQRELKDSTMGTAVTGKCNLACETWNSFYLQFLVMGNSVMTSGVESSR